MNRVLLVAAGLRLMLMGVPSYRWKLERSSAEQVKGNDRSNAITSEGLMIENRMQPKMFD